MIEIKRGDTFLVLGDVAINGVPEPITGWGIRSQVRDRKDVLLADVQVTVTDVGLGKYTLRHDDTTAWPVGMNYCDVEYTTDAGQVISTETFEILVKKDITLPEVAP